MIIKIFLHLTLVVIFFWRQTSNFYYFRYNGLIFTWPPIARPWVQALGLPDKPHSKTLLNDVDKCKMREEGRLSSEAISNSLLPGSHFSDEFCPCSIAGPFLSAKPRMHGFHTKKEKVSLVYYKVTLVIWNCHSSSSCEHITPHD